MTNEPQTVSRRERLRAQTLQDIEDTSFAIIDADGVHALSIAALARSMAMSAPGLYRYFPSRDALLTHLINQSYQHLFTAMSQALEGGRWTPRARVRLLVAAYRDWALQHANRYGMLFGQRIGVAPEDASARTPLDQAMALLVDLLVSIPDGSSTHTSSGDRTLDGQLRTWARAQQRPETTPRIARAAIVIWTRVHGIVSLELTGMLDKSTVEVQRLIDLEVDNAIQLLTPATP
ncbi:TetR/AcrR family transcriptional regulator [Dactylosporangium vinaceum]|uniref:TetR/AcrR family transcriptional regulator n=1 Tax=Dactylosporangium vinaceum TaxID=53362 RepID=A0ABV5MQX8_9ACTN|nr:TetR/AcrR family transcriptional regulator [Dactylosporangium vinaceum]UAB93845.1 TetR/AcrR family transcriptional regulator [Dactylosporangium vinaceum]